MSKCDTSIPFHYLVMLTRVGREAFKERSFGPAKSRGLPLYAKIIAGAAVAYALSPIGRIPGYIPVLGELDDLIIVPSGVALVIKTVPPSRS